MIALGALVVLCLVGLLMLCVSSDRARDAADLALENAVLEAGALRDELARERAARVESDRRRAVAVAHVREVRAELRVTEEHRAHFYFIALDLVCQRDAARSEAVLARHEQVVLPGDCARARGSEMPS